MGQKLLYILRPILQALFLRNPEKLKRYEQDTRQVSRSGMVTQFSLWHRILFKPYFRRVQWLDGDVQKLRELGPKGSLVFVIKNKGGLEYRYFNDLFLKEKLKLASYSNQTRTLFWWPLKVIWKHILVTAQKLYNDDLPEENTDTIAHHLANKDHLFLQLSISRNYLFGVAGKDPFEILRPLVQCQKTLEHDVKLIPTQFLYDKEPERTDRTFFDLMFGEKSRPGFFRKILLMVLSFRRSPQVKFGEAFSLQEFLDEQKILSEEEVLKKLHRKIEDDLSVERAKITGPLLRPKQEVLEKVLNDEDFKNKLRALAELSGESVDDLRRQAEKIFNEIASDVNYSYVQFGYVMLSYLWNRVYDGVVIKHEQLNRVRNAAGKNPIVLVPMHRSHIDYLLISYIFYNQNITFPHICAGINMNFWPVGTFFRKGGAFFIRRSFKGNQIYKETLQAYVKSLLAQNYCLEFFIEGTRSRTGKMLKPKFGILSMILKAFDDGASEDVQFVPISINYDHLLEEKAYESETKGQDKKKENAGELLKTRKIFGKKYGKVYIEFGEPISLKDYIAETKGDDVQTLKETTEAFAYHLTREMNKIAMVTPMSLVSLAILGLGKNTFTFEELQTQIALYKEYLEHKESVAFSDLIQYNEHWAYSQTLERLANRHLIKKVEGYDGMHYHVDARKRGRLDYYKNNILHFFVSFSCVLKIFDGQSASEMALSDVVKEFERIKILFWEEFTFSTRQTLEEHIRKTLRYAEAKGWLSHRGEGSDLTLVLDRSKASDWQNFSRLMNNFLETHQIVLKYLKTHAGEIKGIDRRNLVKDILDKAKPLIETDAISHVEATNQFYLQNSLSTWIKLGILEATKDGRKESVTLKEGRDLLDPWIDCVEKLLKPSVGSSTNASQQAKPAALKSSEDDLESLH